MGGVANWVVLLSGEIASGKSKIAHKLVERHGFKRIGTGSVLLAEAKKGNIDETRESLQAVGDHLDTETNHTWVADLICTKMNADPANTRWILDSVRKEKQVAVSRAQLPGTVLHIHLTAPNHILKKRFEDRQTSGGEYSLGTEYEEVRNHPTEQSVKQLSAIADRVIDTSEFLPNQCAEKVMSLLTK